MKPDHEPLRVAFLTVMPSPYIIDLFDVMTRDGRIAPSICYLESSAPDTHWSDTNLPENSRVLPGRWFRFLGARIHLNFGAIQYLKAQQPDLTVIAGYSGVTNQIVMWWLRLTGRPWIFWGELPGMTRRGRLGNVLRGLARLPAVKWPAGIAAIGSRAATAYRRLAGSRTVVANIPYCCDMEPFFAIPRRGAIEGMPTRFMYCGQLIPRKGVDVLLRAFCRVAAKCEGITLTFVGTGPLYEDLLAQVPVPLKSRVIFTGFQQVDQLPAAFAAADVFVLPSQHDGWGVVVNQAAAAGLPIICSDSVGAAADLVKDNQNGHRFAAGDEGALAGLLKSFAENPGKCAEFGARSREQARDWTPERTIDRWVDLFEEILEPQRVQKPGMSQRLVSCEVA